MCKLKAWSYPPICCTTPCLISVNGNSILHSSTMQAKTQKPPSIPPCLSYPTESDQLSPPPPGLYQDCCSSLLPCVPAPIPADSQRNSKSGPLKNGRLIMPLLCSKPPSVFPPNSKWELKRKRER